MIQFLLAFVISISSALISSYEKWKKKIDPDYHKNNNIVIGLFVIALAGAFLSFISGITAIRKQNKSEIESTNRQVKIDSLSLVTYNLEKLNNSLIGKGLEYSKRLDSISNENFLLSNEVLRLTKDLNDYGFGKGSYCYFDLGRKGPTPNSYRFLLYSSGINPMDDVVARIVDIYDLDSNFFGTTLKLGRIYPKDNRLMFFDNVYRPIRQDSIWLNIFFQTQGREFVEELKEIRSNGKWLVSLIITEEGKVIFKKIDKEFPKGFDNLK
jgi:hypothetical protein